MTISATDRVRHEWSGSGTGTITLGGVVAGYRAFPSAFNGNEVTYLIQHQAPGQVQVELGRGTYTHSGTTLSRDEVLFSTNGDSLVEFTPGVKHVSNVLSAHDLGGRFISILPEGVIDGAADYLLFLDVTDGNLYKIKPEDLQGAFASTPSVVTATPTDDVYDLSTSVRYQPENVLLVTAAEDTAILVPEDSPPGEWKVFVRHDGCVVAIDNDPEGRSINGIEDGDPVPAGDPGSTIKISCLGDNRIRVEGETGEPSKALNDVDMAGFKIGGNLADVLSSISGTLVKATHSGKGLILSGNITVPNGSSDVGFNCMAYAASGSETITFNSLTSPGLTAGESVSIFVWSTTVIEAVGTESGRLTFS